jgi:lipoate-protein ligase A
LALDNIAPRWRLLYTKPVSGARNMALDHTLLEAASDGRFPTTLRFYRWSPPALSIGRFQPLHDIDLDVCAAEHIDVVRRPTGGKSILHLDDFTYSIVASQDFPLPDSVVEAYRVISGGILHAMQHLGLTTVLQSRDSEDYQAAGGACFAAATRADLEYAERKLCGSAQVRRGGAILQHGSIMLEDHCELLFRLLRFDNEAQRNLQLDHYRLRCIALGETGKPYSWTDVEHAFIVGFRDTFGADLSPGSLSAWEEKRCHILTSAYESSQWLVNADSHAFPDTQPPREN